jgi:hypothetical protein
MCFSQARNQREKRLIDHQPFSHIYGPRAHVVTLSDEQCHDTSVGGPGSSGAGLTVGGADRAG